MNIISMVESGGNTTNTLGKHKKDVHKIHKKY